MKRGLSSFDLLPVCRWRMETLESRAAGVTSVLGKWEGLWWQRGRCVPSLLAQHWGLWCRCPSVQGAGRGHSRDVPVCRGPASLCWGLPAGAQGVKLLIARGWACFGVLSSIPTAFPFWGLGEGSPGTSKMPGGWKTAPRPLWPCVGLGGACALRQAGQGLPAKARVCRCWARAWVISLLWAKRDSFAGNRVPA